MEQLTGLQREESRCSESLGTEELPLWVSSHRLANPDFNQKGREMQGDRCQGTASGAQVPPTPMPQLPQERRELGSLGLLTPFVAPAGFL